MVSQPMLNIGYDQSKPGRCIAVLLHVVLLITVAFDASAESSLHCRSEQQKLNDELYQRFVEACFRISGTCVDHHMKERGENREQAIANCHFPLKTAPEYSGPCPELLYELERPEYDGSDSILARADLRDMFVKNRGKLNAEHYKQQESMNSIHSLIASEPNNIGALTYERFNRDRFEPLVDVVAETKSVIRISELDPNCSLGWIANPSALVHLIGDLVESRKEQNSSTSALTDEEFVDLVRYAFDAMQNTYTRVYKSSKNIRKIDYASKLIEHPFMFLNDEISHELGSILNIEPDEFIKNRRNSIIGELEKEYVIDPSSDSRHTLGMICNDVSFQIGLAKQCLALIEHYSETKQQLTSEILNATIFLAMTTSRECALNSKDREEVFMFLHCFFCYQTMYCLTDEEQRLGERTVRIFDMKARGEHEFEYELLKSYTALDESSVMHFTRALDLNNVAIMHATLLAKRLSYKGFQDAALEVLENTFARLQDLNLESVAIDKEDYLGSETCNSTFRLKHEYRDLTGHLSEIEEMRKVLAQGKYYRFFESGRCSLRWDN